MQPDQAAVAAAAALARGWVPVPVHARGKRPFNPDEPGGKGWQNLRPTAEDVTGWFDGKALNVGVLLGAPSNGLADVDLDAEEARALAPSFLPRTDAIFGRLGNPQSHWLYNSAGTATEPFKDPTDKTMLVELRSDGAQTVFPGSVHESGEEIEWANNGDPLDIRPAELRKAVSRLAAAALLARHWPQPGGRHDAQLTLIGGLTRAGWTIDDIAHFVAAVAWAAGGDGDLPKRRATARDTAKRLAADKSVRGYPSLVELVGGPVAEAVAKWLDLPRRAHGTNTFSADSNRERNDRTLEIGSHVEIAQLVSEQFAAQSGGLVFDDGAFWAPHNCVWLRVEDDALRRAVHKFDGAAVHTPSGVSQLRLTRTAIDGVLVELAAIVAAREFFAGAPRGLAVENGFVRWTEDGSFHLESLELQHRVRTRARGVFRCDLPWRPGPETLLGRFLNASQPNDPELQDLLAEIAGIALLGSATSVLEPKAIALVGPTANNGKSTFLNLLRALVPAEATCSISPAKFGDERMLAALAGKALNAADEIGGAALATEAFKAVITGEWVTGRPVYKHPLTFRPSALHVFAANALPPFRDGMDRGVRRRLLVVPFDHVVPEADRIIGIAEKIASTERDLLLGWALAGASRVLARQRLKEPDACLRALNSWMTSADPIHEWLSDPSEVELCPGTATHTRVAYQAFQQFALEAGWDRNSVPPRAGFTQRVRGAGVKGIEYKRRSDGPYFYGLAIRSRTVKR
jgi:P4 family phage/plasmid primase-like protien